MRFAGEKEILANSTKFFLGSKFHKKTIEKSSYVRYKKSVVLILSGGDNLAGEMR
jgi:hypothetical protein